MELLSNIISPFLLRRTKDNVLSDLPNKTEILMYNTDVVSKTLRNKCLNNIRGPVSTLKPINE